MNPLNFKHVRGAAWPSIISDFMGGFHETRAYVQSVHLLQQADANSTSDNWLHINAVPCRSATVESHIH